MQIGSLEETIFFLLHDKNDSDKKSQLDTILFLRLSRVKQKSHFNIQNKNEQALCVSLLETNHPYGSFFSFLR